MCFTPQKIRVGFRITSCPTLTFKDYFLHLLRSSNKGYVFSVLRGSTTQTQILCVSTMRSADCSATYHSTGWSCARPVEWGMRPQTNTPSRETAPGDFRKNVLAGDRPGAEQRGKYLCEKGTGRCVRHPHTCRRKNSLRVNKHSEGRLPLGRGQTWDGKVLLFLVNLFKMVWPILYIITF